MEIGGPVHYDRPLHGTETQLPTQSPSLGSSRSVPKIKRPFSSLDRSLKVFLRASNLPGLEYRLRLARYYTLSDLLDTNVEALCARGFTVLMARRLLNALAEYIQRHLDEEEGANLPFKLVRRGQKILVGPSEQMKALPTYGKQNIKRQKLEDDRRSKPSKLAALGVRNKAAGKTPSRIRLMSDEMLKQQHFVLPTTLEEEEGRRPLQQPPENVLVSGRSEIKGDAVFDGDESEDVDLSEEMLKQQHFVLPTTLEEEEGRRPLQQLPENVLVSGCSETEEDTVFDGDESEDVDLSEEMLKQQHFVLPTTSEEEEEGRRPLQSPENVLVSERSEIKGDTVFDGDESEQVDHTMASRSSNNSPLASSCSLTRSVSVPADVKWSWGAPPEQEPLPWYLQFRVRCYSSPGSLASPPITTIESLVSTLTSTDEASIMLITLRSLVTKCKRHLLDTMTERQDAIAAVADVLQTVCDLPDVAVLCCKALKYLTRNVLPVPGWLPGEVVSAVLLAVDCNLADVRVLTQACLALANIGRADPTLCRTMLFDGGLQSLSSAMKASPWNPGLQVAALSALAVALASSPDSRLRVLTEHDPLLDLVFCAAKNFPSSAAVQQHVCAFHALLLAEVSVHIEDTVMLLVVKHVIVAMGTHSHDPHVTLWGSKVIAHAASNAVLCDWELAGQCCELLVEALTTFPMSSQVQTWGAYALLQLANHHHRISVCELLQGSSILRLCQRPYPTLSSEAHNYLHLLGELADTSAS